MSSHYCRYPAPGRDDDEVLETNSGEGHTALSAHGLTYGLHAHHGKPRGACSATIREEKLPDCPPCPHPHASPPVRSRPEDRRLPAEAADRAQLPALIKALRNSMLKEMNFTACKYHLHLKTRLQLKHKMNKNPNQISQLLKHIQWSARPRAGLARPDGMWPPPHPTPALRPGLSSLSSHQGPPGSLVDLPSTCPRPAPVRGAFPHWIAPGLPSGLGLCPNAVWRQRPPRGGKLQRQGTPANAGGRWPGTAETPEPSSHARGTFPYCPVEAAARAPPRTLGPFPTCVFSAAPIAPWDTVPRCASY